MAELALIAAAAGEGKSVADTVKGVYEELSILDGATEFKERHRSIELFIVNGTTTDLVFESGGEHFDSGTWFSSLRPLVIKPGHGGLALVANRQGSLFCGVSGGLRLLMKGTPYALFLGFTNPQFGCMKTAIHVWDSSKTAQDVYEVAADDTVKRYTEHGYLLVATLRDSKKGGQRMMEFVISKAK
jgi:hypothetical protein